MVSAPQKVSAKELELASRQTPWRSIYISTFFLLLMGIQMSVYLTSTWQYLEENDETATVEFFGIVVAFSCLSAAIANPILGYWNQRTGSARNPAILAFGFSAIGNFIYAFAYLWKPHAKVAIFAGRFLAGLAPGALGVIRTLIATASTLEDRLKAVSLSNTGFTVGFFLGPTVQILFVPLGKYGFTVGPLQVNMYTGCAFFLALVNLFSVVLAARCLVENYVGIISDAEKKEDPYCVVPKYDRQAIVALAFLWWHFYGVISVCSLLAPLTMAMYNWSSEDAVLYNGLIDTISCGVTTATNYSIASTRIGKIDQRKLLVFGLACFTLFFGLYLPWGFYPGPLDRPLNGAMKNASGNANVTDGGCIWEYSWCEETKRVPLWLYAALNVVALGLAFSFVASASPSILSEVLGPRKQGTVQGVFAFLGASSEFILTLAGTKTFKDDGYKYLMGYHLVTTLLSIVAVFVCWGSLVRLRLTPDHLKATKYKHGTFYRI